MSLEILKSRDRLSCPAFLNYVRSLSCCICESKGEKQKFRTSASHLRSSKYADGSDALAVPACISPSCHPQSTKSAREIVEKYTDVKYLHWKLWNGFIAEQGDMLKVFTQSQFEGYLRERGFVELPFSRRKNR